MASYPIAPWIQPPPNLGQEYLSGLQIGAHISQQQAQLQQEAQQAAMAAQVKQQQLQQEHQIKQQQILVDQSYYDQQAQIAKQKLDEAQQLNQAKVRDAMRQVALQQAYSKRVAAGEDASKVMLEMGPELGAGEQSIAAAFRARSANQPTPPPSVEKYAGQDFLRIPEPGGRYRMQEIKEPTAKPDKYKFHFQDGKWFRENSDGTIQEVEVSLPGGAQAPAAPTPLPKSKDEMVLGKLYQTAYGNLYWDGKKLVPNKPAEETTPAPEPRARIVGGAPDLISAGGVADDYPVD